MYDLDTLWQIAGGPISMQFGTLVQNDMTIEVIWSKLNCNCDEFKNDKNHISFLYQSSKLH